MIGVEGRPRVAGVSAVAERADEGRQVARRHQPVGSGPAPASWPADAELAREVVRLADVAARERMRDEGAPTAGAAGAAGAADRAAPAESPAASAERRRRFDAEALGHLDAMFSFALKLARSRDDAEDLVSDTLLRAFERWEQYRLGTNIRAWLFTILYHVFVSRKRRVDAREVQPAEGGEGRAAYDPVGEADPEGRFYDSFLDEEITRAIDALPVEYRAAVVLSDVHELRYAEIAQILDVPEGTVKSRLFRGRRLLQKKLRGYAVDMGYIKEPRVA